MTATVAFPLNWQFGGKPRAAADRRTPKLEVPPERQFVAILLEGASASSLRDRLLKKLKQQYERRCLSKVI